MRRFKKFRKMTETFKLFFFDADLEGLFRKQKSWITLLLFVNVLTHFLQVPEGLANLYGTK